MAQIEPTQSDFILVFVLLNLTLGTAFILYRKRKVSILPWLMALLFCVFARWETDYFTYQNSFIHGIDEDYRDPLYYYIQYLALGSYSLYRIWIWGSALLFFYLTCRNMRVSYSLSIFVFISSFLMTFSYARASLAMSIYFYSLSILISKHMTLLRCVRVLILFAISFIAHRSMLPVILFTPLIFIPQSRLLIILILIAVLPLQFVANFLMSQFIDGQPFMEGSLASFGESATQYASFKYDASNYNWKFALMSNLRYISIYLVFFTVIKKMVFGYFAQRVSLSFKRLVLITSLVIMIASVFLLNPSKELGAMYIIGYRFLYISILPLTIMLAYVVQRGACKQLLFSILIIISLLYQEGYLIGKILSF